jgi:hypothetical protein
VSRRSVLLAGAGLVLGAGAAACGGGSSRTIKVNPSRPGKPPLNAGLVTFGMLSGSDQRVTFAVLSGEEPLGRGEDVTVAFAPEGGRLGPPLPATRHDQGIEGRPYYELTYRFDHAGNWLFRAFHGQDHADAAFEVVAPEASPVPTPGRTLISTPTPTPSSTQGVNPICTRTPPCPWHDVSLDAALTQGRPIALLFATPARCESRTCGPVLEILLGGRATYEPRVRFVHVEIYKDLQTQARVPAVETYRLEAEPILFLAGPDGVVRERFAGAFDRLEAKAALDRLVS